MGVGDPVSLVEAVALGVDLFDCVLPEPARPPRHRAHRRGPHQPAERPLSPRDDSPIDESSPSPVSARYSRGYVRHLLTTDEPTARRLLTLHNLGWLLRFVDRMRASIEQGAFEAFRADVEGHLGCAEAAQVM